MAEIVSLAISPTEESLDAVGAEIELTATGVDESGDTVRSLEVDWTSDDPSVATVSDSGVVTAVQNGSTAVRANSGGLSAQAHITVSQSPATLDFTSEGPASVPGAADLLPQVQVRDRLGNPIAGLTVLFTVENGGGELQAPEAVTDAQGLAGPGRWTLSQQPQSNVLRADLQEYDVAAWYGVPVITDPVTLSIPGTTLVSGGRVVQDTITVDRTGIVLVQRGADYFLFTPMTEESPDQLSGELTARSFAEFVGNVFDAPEQEASPADVSGAGQEIAGVRITDHSTNFTFTNAKSRAVGLRFSSRWASLSDPAWILPARGSIADFNPLRPVYGLGDTFTSLHEPERTRSIYVPTDVEAFGSIISIVAVPVVAAKSSVWKAAATDPELFWGTNVYDGIQVGFSIAQSVLDVVPFECADAAFTAALRRGAALLASRASFLAAFQEQTGEAEWRKAAAELSWAATTNLAGCACVAVTQGGCEVVASAVDFIDLGVLLADHVIRASDVVLTPAYGSSQIGVFEGPETSSLEFVNRCTPGGGEWICGSAFYSTSELLDGSGGRIGTFLRVRLARHSGWPGYIDDGGGYDLDHFKLRPPNDDMSVFGFESLNPFRMYAVGNAESHGAVSGWSVNTRDEFRLFGGSGASYEVISGCGETPDPGWETCAPDGSVVVEYATPGYWSLDGMRAGLGFVDVTTGVGQFCNQWLFRKESNLSKLIDSGCYKVTPHPSKPDLTVWGMEVVPPGTWESVPDQWVLRGKLANLGVGDADESTSRYWLDGREVGTSRENRVRSGSRMGSGGQVYIDSIAPGEHTLSVQVDTFDEIDESNESNNFFTMDFVIN